MFLINFVSVFRNMAVITTKKKSLDENEQSYALQMNMAIRQSVVLCFVGLLFYFFSEGGFKGSEMASSQKVVTFLRS